MVRTKGWMAGRCFLVFGGSGMRLFAGPVARAESLHLRRCPSFSCHLETSSGVVTSWLTHNEVGLKFGSNHKCTRNKRVGQVSSHFTKRANPSDCGWDRSK